ncbi:hypothetical protein [Pseudomonas agarici]|nr:hypothetical protein [Pseudomonas agarici]
MQPLAQTSAAGRVELSATQNLEGLKQKMADVFEPHRTVDNGGFLDALINDRAKELQQLGQTAADVESMLSKANGMDRVTIPVHGAVGSIPFAVATVLLDKVPGISADAANSPAYAGLIAGTVSGALDVVGNGLLSRATHDAFWFKAPTEKLEPVMQAAQKAKASENRLIQAGQSALALQTFTVRNVVRGILNTSLTATEGSNTAAAVDTGVTALGGMVAGAGSNIISRSFDLKAHRAGPEYLFGRQDWKEQYQKLRDCNPRVDPLTSALKRIAKLPVDIMTDALKSASAAISMSSLANNGLALGGGFALAGEVRSAVKGAATEAGLSLVKGVALDQLANVVMSALAFAAFGATATLVGPASDGAVKVLQEDLPPKAQAIAKQVHAEVVAKAESASRQISSSYTEVKQGVSHVINEIGGAASSGADRLAGMVNNSRLRNRPAAPNPNDPAV